MQILFEKMRRKYFIFTIITNLEDQSLTVNQSCDIQINIRF